MKRSLICFSILAAFVAAVICIEVGYCNSVSRDIERLCLDSARADLQTRKKLADDLRGQFDSREPLNELLFSRKIIKGIGRELDRIIICSENGDGEGCDIALGELSRYGEDLRYAGVF